MAGAASTQLARDVQSGKTDPKDLSGLQKLVLASGMSKLKDEMRKPNDKSENGAALPKGADKQGTQSLEGAGSKGLTGAVPSAKPQADHTNTAGHTG